MKRIELHCEKRAYRTDQAMLLKLQRRFPNRLQQALSIAKAHFERRIDGLEVWIGMLVEKVELCKVEMAIYEEKILLERM